MRVTCTGRRDVPDDWQGDHHMLTACGREFEVEVGEHDRSNPGDPTTWDVHTDPNGVVLRHTKSIMCPYCGTENFVVKEDL